MLQWAGDDSLLEANQVRRRMEILDRLEAHFPDAESRDTESGLNDPDLNRRANAIRARLEAANTELYQSIRLEIRRGICPAIFLQLLQESSSRSGPFRPSRGVSYDYLDELISGVMV